MSDNKFEVWVDGIPKKGSIESLIHMSMQHGIKSICYIEKEEKKMLVSFVIDSNGIILKDGTHSIKRAITDILFAEVKEYKRLVIYNHTKGCCTYTDTVDGINPDDAMYVVLQFSSIVLDAIADHILKLEK